MWGKVSALLRLLTISGRSKAEKTERQLVATTDIAEVDGLAVRWTMSDGKSKIVCWARSTTLEKLAADPNLEKSNYLAAFQKHRNTLESAARAIFKRGLLDGNAIVVRKENV